MTLKGKTFSAIRWTTVSAVYRALLQVMQVAILARLLQPEDYGLVAIITVVLTFTTLFSDLGVSSAYVHRRDVTEEQRSSLFWLNIAVSGVLVLLLVLVSPLLTRFFGNARLQALLTLSAATFFINALGQQIKIDAEKSLNFRPLMMLEVISSTAGFGVAVTSAVLRFGVYSIVIGSIVAAFVSTLFAWFFIAKEWRPLWRFRVSDVSPFVGYGSSMVVSAIATQFHVAMDLLMGGRLLGTTQLGLYSVPRSLMLQVQFAINPIITRVGFPLIAQIQDDKQRVRSVFLKTINMTASTNAPIYAVFACYASEVVNLLIGEKWSESSQLLRILAVWGFVRSTANPVGSLLFGMGRPGLALKWNLALVVIVPVALWLGSGYGGVGLAFAMLALSTALFIPGWYFLVRPVCKISLLGYSVAALRPLVISIIGVGISYFMVAASDSPIYRAVIGIPIGFLLYCGMSYWLNREWVQAMFVLFGIELKR